jgi:hypothetical protein
MNQQFKISIFCLITLSLVNAIPSSSGSEKFNDNYWFDWSIESKAAVEYITL